MTFKIRRFEKEDLETILEISIFAFTPIHESFEKILGSKIFKFVHPDWKNSQLEYIRSLCIGEDKENFLVTEEDKNVIGFLSFFMDTKKKSGELGINAVHPEHQNKGIGKSMYEYAISIMKENGVELVEVSTGGDPSHAPACNAYEKCGFTPFPLVRYYKTL